MNADVYELTPSGDIAGASPFAVDTAPVGVGMDDSGRVWVTCSTNNDVTALTPSGDLIGMFAPAARKHIHAKSHWDETQLWPGLGRELSIQWREGVLSSVGTVGTNTTVGGTGTGHPSSVAIDGGGNAWVVNSTSGSVAEITAGMANATNSPFSAGGIGNNSQPTSVAIDGAGTAWVANAGTGSSITQLSSTGAAMSPSTGYTAVGLSNPGTIVADGSGNVWVTNPQNTGAGTTVIEFIGIATPVATPLSYAVAHDGLGQRP